MTTIGRTLSIFGAAALATSFLSCEEGYPDGYPTPDLSSGIDPDLATALDLPAADDLAMSPAPTLSAVSPRTGPNLGGTLITIMGTGFLPGAAVTIDGTACSGVTVVSATAITCTTPAQAGTCGAVAVVVENPDTQSATGNLFSYSSKTFALATGSNIANGTGSRAAVVADFNGDGKNDVANLSAAVAGLPAVSVQLGSGAGTFAAVKHTNLAAGQDPAAMAVGDVDGNGAADVVLVLNASSSNPQALVMLGQKDGTFKAHAGGPVALSKSSAPTAVAVATADSKTKPYVVISGTSGSRAAIDVLRNDGTGALSGLTQTVVGGILTSASHVTLADLSGNYAPPHRGLLPRSRRRNGRARETRHRL